MLTVLGVDKVVVASRGIAPHTLGIGELKGEGSFTHVGSLFRIGIFVWHRGVLVECFEVDVGITCTNDAAAVHCVFKGQFAVIALCMEAHHAESQCC